MVEQGAVGKTETTLPAELSAKLLKMHYDYKELHNKKFLEVDICFMKNNYVNWK